MPKSPDSRTGLFVAASSCEAVRLASDQNGLCAFRLAKFVGRADDYRWASTLAGMAGAACVESGANWAAFRSHCDND